MLIAISDLHFVDGTAGEHNLPARVFTKVLDRLDAVARFKAARIREVEVVFVGDIFDVARSQRWFKSSVGQDDMAVRPWGTAKETHPPTHAKIVKKSRSILAGIIRHPQVAAACEAFRSWKSILNNEGIPVRFRYVPGNHDRFLHAESGRRGPCGPRPPTPPDVRLRIRRFEINSPGGDAPGRGS